MSLPNVPPILTAINLVCNLRAEHDGAILVVKFMIGAKGAHAKILDGSILTQLLSVSAPRNTPSSVPTNS